MESAASFLDKIPQKDHYQRMASASSPGVARYGPYLSGSRARARYAKIGAWSAQDDSGHLGKR